MLEILQNIFNTIGVDQQVNSGDLWGIGCLFFLLIAIVIKSVSGSPSKQKKAKPKIDVLENKQVETPDSIEKKPEEKSEKKLEKRSWDDRLSKGLSRSSLEIWGKVFNLFSNANANNEDLIEEVEELLYGADLGPSIVGEIIDNLEMEIKSGKLEQEKFKQFLFNNLKSKIDSVQKTVPEYFYTPPLDGSLKVIMIVGVNGAGKTTTIGKLATKLTSKGANVVVGACDTFRAAAVDQLQVWCDRAGATMIRAKEGANPSGVGYDALQKAVNLKADYCLLDTAGRLHTKDNLMMELKKSKNVLQKLIPEAPHERILVLDAITGQNALKQAEEFNKTLNLSGLVFTKCDGSSKAGSAISIVEKLQVPISYIGVGESVDDLDKFVVDDYLDALLGINK